MSKENLQTLLDRLGDGETLKLDPPRGEFKGPVVLRKPVVIEGQGGSIWTPTGPVLCVESRGVVLRDLAVEITSRDASLSGDDACAIRIQSATVVDLSQVVVRGTVIGLPDEEGTWHFPRNLSLGGLRANLAHVLRLKLVTPVPCTLVSEIDAIKVDPHTLPAGATVVTLKLDSLPAGTRLRGQLLLRTRQLIRRIEVVGHYADNGISGNGQLLWRPPGDTTPEPGPAAAAAPAPAEGAPRTITLNFDLDAPALADSSDLPALELVDADKAAPSQPGTKPVHAPSAATTPVTPAPTTGPDTLVVSAFESGQFRTIAEALQRARTGSKVLIRPGVYRENLTLTRRIELVGDGPASEVVIESTDGNCLLLQADLARVRGLTLRGSSGKAGRDRYAVHVPQGQLILESCRISSDSLACLAVAGQGSNLVLRRCQVRGGASAGVLVLDRAEAVLEDCEIGEHALAGVESRRNGNVTLRQCQLFTCGQAGVLTQDQGKASLEECDLYSHTLAAVESRSGGEATLRRCKVRNNQGAGVRVHSDGKALLEGCDLFENGLAHLEARLGGNPTLKRCKLRQGKQAGALFGRDGQGTLEDCEFLGNARSAVEIKENANPTLRRCSVRQCGDVGVAVRDGGKGLLEECDLAEARLAVVELRQTAAPVLKKCKIHDGAKAGVLAVGRASGRLEECEVFGNQGPGVVISKDANPTLKSCRVHDNGLAGVVVWANGRGVLDKCTIDENGLSGLAIGEGGAPRAKGCRVTQNRDVAVWAGPEAEGSVEDCDLTGNRQGAYDIDGGSRLTLAENMAET
jgi:hypothetical protein